MAQTRLLVIDDEESMRHMLESMLAKEGYAVSSASRGKDGMEMLGEEVYDIVLCDVRMPEMDGIAFLKKAREAGFDTPVVIMSAYGAIEVAVEAIKAGACDYISKPFNVDEILLTLKKEEERSRLTRENIRLREAVERSSSFSNIVGKSDKMQDLFRTIKKVAAVKSNVLLLGESGTGKELVAQAIHYNSERKKAPFVAVNCGAIPENLIESELFGHVRGAFTDAVAARKGLFEEADGGTLFLDEIGELPLALQVKLLRVLQESEVKRVGGSSIVKVDVRVVAATTKNLAEEAKEGRFREDLYYRLNVLVLTLPPLRERMEDLPLLAEHFINSGRERLGVGTKSIDRGALKALNAYSWPGNVRELENAIERAMVMAEGDVLTESDLPPEVGRPLQDCAIKLPEDDLSIKKNGRMLEDMLIRKALEKTGGNRTHAAKLLEISHRALIYKIKDYHLL